VRDRVRCLRRWRPSDGWPDWEDAALLNSLEHWLTPWLGSVQELKDLRKLNMHEILSSELGWNRQQQLNTLAPTHLTVPSGHRRPLTYQPDGQPVLAVKLQEVFGLSETPRICADRIPLLLHLLSPAGRPIQVTQDLESFWENTYPEVCKELRGRYPKHPWPDDPWAAQPTARAKGR
jgi:ATP-dependent helicase HrpB